MAREKSNSLTRKQAETLEYIKKFMVSHGYPPSVREICSGMNLSSPEFEVKEETEENTVSVPLLGKVSCGNPIEAIENPDEFFSIPTSLIPAHESVFTLQCQGDSMINVGIYDKDIVIVQKQSVAKNGEIVVAMTEDNEVTLKTFYKEIDHIRLQPENDSLSPIILPNCTILGKAIGLYRKI